MDSYTGLEIAIIGMSGRFPGADNIEQYWENLKNGVESIKFFTDEELMSAGVDPTLIRQPDYVKAKGILNNIEYFDASFFDYTPNDAKLMDPQVRIFHECVYEALEDACYDPNRFSGLIGVYAGASSNIYWELVSLLNHHSTTAEQFSITQLNDKDFMSTRMSYKLNLCGPSYNLQTACSTSLVAVDLACQGLLTGKCDIALAGGVSIVLPQRSGYQYKEGMIFSPDGHCRAFDADSKGTVEGSGAGVVVLKRLEEALEDGDQIYAVIKGSAANNDGVRKVGYTAPSVDGQKEVIQAAQSLAEVDPESITYVETHGTATALGDLVEIEALNQAFKTDRKQYCYIGSVKTNIGHLDAAAGIAGLIKTTMALKERIIPPSLHFKRPNPRIDFANTPFKVNTKLREWKQEGSPLRAGVSSFGIGGTNVHLVLEEAPELKQDHIAKEWKLIVLSAKSETALAKMAENLSTFMKRNPQIPLEDIAYNLQLGRAEYNYRIAMLGRTHDEILDQLCSNEYEKVEDSASTTILIFPSKFHCTVKQAADFYQNHSVFKEAVDKCINIANAQGFDLKPVLLEKEQGGNTLSQSFVIKSLITFTLEYALGTYLLELGADAKAFTAQGTGRYVAGCLSGIYDLDIAIHAVIASAKAYNNEIKEEEYESFLSSVKYSTPGIPLLSIHTGERIEDSKVASAEYWLQESIDIDINDRLEALEVESRANFITVEENLVLEDRFMNTIKALWIHGGKISWENYYGKEKRYKISLPTYPFERQRYFIDVDLSLLLKGEGKLNVVSEKEETEDQSKYQPRPKMRIEYVEAENATEKKLVRVWEQFFQMKGIGTLDDFFEIGGDSLSAINIITKMEEEFGVKVSLRTLFEEPTIREISKFIEVEQKNNGRKEQHIAKAPKLEYYPVSSAQKRMYFLQELDRESVAYNISSVIEIEGKLDLIQLDKSIKDLINRQESFRTSFELRDNHPVQIIHEEIEFELEKERINEEDIETAVVEFIQPFDLSNAPLLRGKLLLSSGGKTYLLIDMHHIISDGISIGIIMNEILDFYEGKTLPEMKLQYKDYSVWSNEYVSSEKLQKQEEFWLNKLSGELPILNIPTDYARPGIQSFDGDLIEFKIDKELSEQVKSFALDKGITPYMVFMGAYILLLWKFSGQEDIIVGTATAGRNYEELQGIVGMFVNTIAVRTQIDAQNSIEEFLLQVKETILEGYENQDYPIEVLIDKLELKKEVSRNPLFDIVFSYLNNEVKKVELEDLKLTSLNINKKSSMFDMTCLLWEEVDGFKGHMEYSVKLFKEDTIQRFITYMKHALLLMINNSEEKLKDIDIITSEERNQIVKCFNYDEIDYPKDKLIIQLFEEQVERTPDHVAVVYEEQKITYHELNEWANKVGFELRKKGIREESIVAIMIDRSIEMIVGILGIIKAGGAYLPMDPSYPEERVKYIVEDSNAALVLTKECHANKLPSNAETVYIDELRDSDMGYENMQHVSKADSMLYVIYTSGTTGQPKGVVIENRNVISLLMNRKTHYDFCDHDVWTMYHNYYFDFSVWEMYGALLFGGKLVVVPKEVAKDTKAFVELVKREGVTVLNQTPQAFYNFIEEELDQKEHDLKIKYIIFGGEALHPGRLKRWKEVYPDTKLINMYGITETTVHVTYKEITDENIKENRSNIGKPIPTLKAYILDKYQRMVPMGVCGELYIEGEGVCRGYLNREELTRSRFLTSILPEANRLYRTGDLGRYLENGDIEYLGRIDNQVKVRGFRIELGEIENCILRHEAVKEALVITREDNQKNLCLCTYYTASRSIKVSEMREYLLQILPDYMLPSYFIQVDQMPLTNNGKINRDLLPDIRYYKASEMEYRKPRNILEANIINVWKDILNLERIGIEDNYFELGGHSLSIVVLHKKLKEIIDKDFPMVSLFQYPTIKSFANFIMPEDSKESEESLEETACCNSNLSSSIAIIGMAGRFPGADSVNSFWENLKNGVESIHYFTDEELLEAGVDLETIRKSNYVKAKGIVDGIEYFDASFFDYTPSDARQMDPQVRVFHECVYEALEDACYDTNRYKGKIGLYAGASSNLYWQALSLLSTGKMESEADFFSSSQLNNKDYMSSRVAYKMNFRGPCYSLQTACSTSLVNVYLACEELLNHKCDIALAGGVSIVLPQKSGYQYSEGMIFSPDGHCRAFDEASKGTVEGSGAGVVVLKRLDEAISDGDNIYAVIKGSAANNDGVRKVGYSAPSVDGQMEVIRAAQSMADVSPESITYVETHGTATELGDLVEIEALRQAFSTDKREYCWIGSVKTNIGHLDAAAGVAGLIKTSMAMRKKLLPPSINFVRPNPRIDFKNSPFKVNTELREWKQEYSLLRAGVSSFGIGGTNVHVVLEEAPQVKSDEAAKEYKLFLLSAKTEASLAKMSENLAEYIVAHPEVSLDDIAYSLQVGRGEYAFRKAVIAKSQEEAVELLTEVCNKYALGSDQVEVNTITENANSAVIFLFTDSCACKRENIIEIYKTSKMFRDEFDQFIERAKEQGYHLRSAIFEKEPSDQTNIKSDDVVIKSLLTLAEEYSLGTIIRKLGVEPGAVHGQGVGEIAAACLYGVFDVQSGIEAVIAWAKLHEKDISLHEYESIIRKITYNTPTVPFVNKSNGSRVSDSEVASADFWLQELDTCDSTQDVLKSLRFSESTIIIPFGSETDLSNCLTQNGHKDQVQVIQIVQEQNDQNTAEYTMVKAIGKLWLYGFELNWEYYHENEKRLKVSLPTYPFERQKYWIEGDLSALLKGGNNHIVAKEKEVEKEVEDQSDYQTRPRMRTAYVEASSSTEKRLIQIWESFFRIKGLGVLDDFFEIGGDSLNAINIITKMEKIFAVKIPLHVLFDGPSIKEIGEYIAQEQKESVESDCIIPKAPVMECYPVSSAQKRIYLQQQLDIESSAYNISNVLEIEGDLNISRLVDSFLSLIDRQESFRTSFELRNSNPVQIIHEKVEFQVLEEELKGENIEEAVDKFIQPFDLTKAPLLRAKVLHGKENKKYLLVDMHHIISDGMSVGILMEELVQLYEGISLSSMKRQYKDYSNWSNERITKGQLSKEKEYWLSKFAGDLPILNMPTDYKRPSTPSFDGRTYHFSLDGDMTRRMKEICVQKGLTLYMFMLASFNVLLHKITGQNDIIIGSPISGRRQDEIFDIIGMFVGTLALRNNPTGEMSFRSFLEEIKENSLKASENQDYQFDDLVEQVVKHRDFSRNPIFDVMFSIVNDETREMKLEGMKLKSIDIDTKISKFDLTLTIQEKNGTIECAFEYRTQLFKKETIEGFTKGFLNILNKVLNHIEIQIKDIEFISEEEKQTVLYDFNQTKAEYPEDKSIVELFEEQVRKNPDKIAITYEDESLTYHDLSEKSNHLASILLAQGVKPQSNVGILIERSCNMIIGILGILKTGAAYLPIIPSLPNKRIEFMIEDSNTTVVVTRTKFLEKIDDLAVVINMDSITYTEELQVDISMVQNSSSTACIVYTSGTTGKPKGVLIKHQNIVRTVINTNFIEFKTSDIVLQTSNYMFDGSFLDIYGSLLNGAQLVIIKDTTLLDINALSKVIESSEISVFFLTTALFNALVDIRLECMRNVRKIMFGGEKASFQHVKRAFEYLGPKRLMNGYGPTEATVFATYYEVNSIDNQSSMIPIGKPLSNCSVYILDQYNKVMPIGVPGELCIGGKGIAAGYLNREELTNLKFVENPFENGSKMYRTGDLVRWKSDGNIEFIDRVDQQVKIRGFRIELTEIEAILLRIPEIKNAVVIVREEVELSKYLCAYIIAEQKLETELIKDTLSGELPEYMIPSIIMQLDTFPLNQNGKVDRKALPLPSYTDLTMAQYEAPSNDTEERLTKIFQSILNLDKIGVNDNFFEIGGQSIRAMGLMNELNQEFAMDFTMDLVFRNATVKKLAHIIETRRIEEISRHEIETEEIVEEIL